MINFITHQDLTIKPDCYQSAAFSSYMPSQFGFSPRFPRPRGKALRSRVSEKKSRPCGGSVEFL